jgi:hypothetical protein
MPQPKDIESESTKPTTEKSNITIMLPLIAVDEDGNQLNVGHMVLNEEEYARLMQLIEGDER